MRQDKRTTAAQQLPTGEPDAFVISLEGEFDIAERVRLLDALAVTTNSSLVVISFEKTNYVDSSVLECLVALERTIAQRGGKLFLVGLRADVRRIFEVCALERLFDIRGKLSDVTDLCVLDSTRIRRLELIAEPSIGPDPFKPYWGDAR
jgi:anti-anti-sigma factor